MASLQANKLYLDILNYSDSFFDIDNWDIKSASQKVEKFISAAHNSGLQLKVFIDARIKTDESLIKWRVRREEELIERKKNMPQGNSTLIGDLFRLHGVDVAYSVEADNDDTLAFHACADGADVLSRDKDFFRYRGATYTIYKNFSYRKGHLVLEKHPGPSYNPRYGKPKERPIQVPPKTCDTKPLFESSQDGIHLYRRGVASPLVRDLDNPHLKTRQLRKALYHRLRIHGVVIEEFPVWDNESNQACWEKKEVKGDGELDALLDSPKEALLHVYKTWPPIRPPRIPQDKFDKHVFAMKSVVFEICSQASGDNLSELMMKF